jgi:hypothetical protein
LGTIWTSIQTIALGHERDVEDILKLKREPREEKGRLGKKRRKLLA